MSRATRDLEVKRGGGLLPRGGSNGARQTLLGHSLRNNSRVIAGDPVAKQLSRRLGKAQLALSRRMARKGQRADRGIFGNSRGPIQ